MAGNGVGLWMILPGREYIDGGPLRQELTVHMDNVLLWMFQGTHFGAGAINLKAGQKWSLFYGPAFVYFNQGSSIDALWQDARIRAVSEETRWPYNFVNNPDYPLSRGTVIGQVKLGNGDSTKGAWAVLAPPGTKDWCQSSGGYTFWTRTDDSGHFVIPKVRPGSYTLFVSGANQFVDYRQDAIQVGPGKIIDLGTLTWKPVINGRTLWQIGVADRSTREFKNGDDVRHYDNFIRYAREFPDDVTFTIGKSEIDKDWNFAQWGWYHKNPYWTIRFDEPKTLSGRATLTIGVCSSSDRHLQVKANGREIGVLNLPKTGTAPYRSGGQDSEYHVYTLRFDATWLKAGTNEITLGIEGAVPFANPDEARPARIGAVMYDAIRLEVQE
jgi:rhamnogalacturonan endolyase